MKTLDADFKYARVDKHPFANFFAIILGCGLRPGEVRALTWANVDMKKKNITVASATSATGTNIKEPKTKAGYRTIPMPDWLYERLRVMPHDDLSYLFKGNDGKPITKQRYERAWKSFHRLMDVTAGAKVIHNEVVIHAIDQDITPYYLRHTYATGLVEAGVDIKTAQYLLGHSDIRMTLQIYSHVTEKMIDAAREKINNSVYTKPRTLRIKRVAKK